MFECFGHLTLDTIDQESYTESAISSTLEKVGAQLGSLYGDLDLKWKNGEAVICITIVKNRATDTLGKLREFVRLLDERGIIASGFIAHIDRDAGQQGYQLDLMGHASIVRI